MYYRYVNSSTRTLQGVINDLALLICGGSIAACSSSCDKTQSVQVANTIPSGWRIVDTFTNAYGTWPVLGALDTDSRTTKYVVLCIDDTSASSASSGYIAAYLYETWNTTTHTGTNSRILGNPGRIDLTSATGSTFAIYATKTVLFLGLTARNGSGNDAFGQMFITEVTRSAAYLQNSNYPVHISIDLTKNASLDVSAYICRYKDFSTLGDKVASNLYINCPMITDPYWYPVRDENEQPTSMMYPVWAIASKSPGTVGANSTGTTIPAMIVGQVLDVLMLPAYGTICLDEISDGKDTYIVLCLTNTITLTPTTSGYQRFGVKKG